MRTTLKQLLRSYVEQGLSATPAASGSQRSVRTLPRVEGALAISGKHLSNAALGLARLALPGVQGWPAPPLATRSIGFNVVGAREG